MESKQSKPKWYMDRYDNVYINKNKRLSQQR